MHASQRHATAPYPELCDKLSMLCYLLPFLSRCPGVEQLFKGISNSHAVLMSSSEKHMLKCESQTMWLEHYQDKTGSSSSRHTLSNIFCQLLVQTFHRI